MEHRNSHNTDASHRRKQQIETCLYEAMLRTPYRSISVSDLCSSVGISRKAFYNYYRDKDDCLCSIIDQILREATLRMTMEMEEHASSLEITEMLLNHWKRNRDLLDILVRNDLLHLLMIRNMEYVLKEENSILALLDTPELHTDADILACYVSCQLTLVIQWYSRGFDTPTEEMAKKLLRIVHRPLITVKEE